MSAEFYRGKCKWGEVDTIPLTSNVEVDGYVDSPSNAALIDYDILRENKHHTPRARAEGFLDLTVILHKTVFGENAETMPTSEYAAQPKKSIEDNYDHCALVIRRILQRRGDLDYLERIELQIRSKTLCASLRHVIPYTYDSIDISSYPIVLPAPFYELFLKREEISLFCEDESNHQTLRTEMKLLRDYIRGDRLTLSQIDHYNSLLSQGKISYESTWALFPPNELLLLTDGEEPECWLCRDIVKHTKSPLTWEITGIRVDFNGRRLGMVRKSWLVSFAHRVDGKMDISQLPIIPVKHLPEHKWSATKSRLVERGQKFRSLMGPKLDGHAYMYYEGPIRGENIRLDSKVYVLDSHPSVNDLVFS